MRCKFAPACVSFPFPAAFNILTHGHAHGSKKNISAFSSINGSIDGTTTVFMETLEYFGMPKELQVVTLIFLSCNAVLSTIASGTLTMTIWQSPSLKTPPNAHLINICINNINVAICMVLSFLTVILSKHLATFPNTFRWLDLLLLFFTCASFLQYWCSFASIGIYRSKTVKMPSMSLNTRKKLVSRSIAFGWISCTVLSLTLLLAFRDSRVLLAINPFYVQYNLLEKMANPTVEQSAILYALLAFALIALAVIARCYIRILKRLQSTSMIGRGKVTPLMRASIPNSDLELLEMPTRRSYSVKGTVPSEHPFTVSDGSMAIVGAATDTFTVHFQKRRDHSLIIEDVISFECPKSNIRQNGDDSATHPTLHQTLSNSSTSSRPKQLDFTDISPGAELHRFQRIKNRNALRKQTLRRDRISLSSATKNSFIMLGTFLACSLPLILSCVPGLFAMMPLQHQLTVSLFCRLLFYINAPAYPMWYLIFSKRVRKCLYRLYENTLIRLNIKQ